MDDDLDRELLMELIEHTAGMEAFGELRAALLRSRATLPVEGGIVVAPDAGAEGEWVVP